MKDLLNKILKSRTIWTLLFLIVFNAFNSASGLIDQSIFSIINSIMLTVAMYFRIDTKATFDK